MIFLSDMEKKCAKCKAIKGISEFNKLSRASDGLNYRCKDCCNNYYNSLYPKIKDKKIESSKVRYAQKKQIILEKVRASYDKNKKHSYNQSYYKLIKSDPIKLDKSRKRSNTYEKNRVLTDKNYKLIKTMRKLVYRTLKNKKNRTASLLGYSSCDLLNEIGRYPDKGESLDHKIPVSWFIDASPVNIISHLKNLHILNGTDNYRKNNLFSHPIDESYYLIALPYIKEEYKQKLSWNKLIGSV